MIGRILGLLKRKGALIVPPVVNDAFTTQDGKSFVTSDNKSFIAN